MNTEELLEQLTTEEKASLCSGEDYWHTKSVERLGIPGALLCDGPNGLRKQTEKTDHLGLNAAVPAVCFPAAAAIAASFDRTLAYRLGELLGEECQAEQVAMLLGPGLNIKRSPLCGRNFEYYSEDPYLTGQMAESYIKGLQSRGVGACVKHFAANNQETCRQSGDSVVDERTLHEIYLAGFETAVKHGKPWGVMCAYNRLNGTFCSENRFLLTEVLREQWGFDGMVVTDWGAVKDRVKGLEAGLDLEMPGGSGARANDRKLAAAVEARKLPVEALDRSARRALTFLRRAEESQDTSAHFDREADYRACVALAEECAVLLKNERNTLPLKKGARVAFLGGFLNFPRIQGGGSAHVSSAKSPTLLELLPDNVRCAKGFLLTTEETDEALLEEAVALARESEAAVIFAGLPEAWEAEGADRTHLRLPANQNELIAAVCAVQPATVVVLQNGAPVELPWVGQAAAILELYLCGDGTSEAALRLLYGDANPSGHLAETFPLRLQDTPCYLDFPGERGRTEYREGIFVGYRWYDKREMPVLFPFGHGLSYTEFQYSGLTLSRDTVSASETVQALVTVTNVGSREGKAVVQLYVSLPTDTVRHPLRELKEFSKVSLSPGESKTVAFTLTGAAFSYYEPEIHDWYVESGRYEISVGASSRDLRETAFLRVNAVRRLPIDVNRETSVRELLRFHSGAQVFGKLFGEGLLAAAASKDAGGNAMLASALDMPVGALVSFGRMDEETLEGLLDAVREEQKAARHG